MLIFLDTEFSDFVQPQLISIGLAADTGEEFYAELADVDVARCSEFVKNVVLPQLGKVPDRIFDAARLKLDLAAWLSQFSEREPAICYDFEWDWLFLEAALQEEIPLWLSEKNVGQQIDDSLRKQFFMDSGLKDHHALHDAAANRFAYRPNAGRHNPP